MVTSIIEWVSVADRLPHIGGSISCDDILFVVGNRVYSGYFHMNGCFYGYEKGVIASSPEFKDNRFNFPAAKYWSEMPPAPSRRDGVGVDARPRRLVAGQGRRAVANQRRP